MTNKRLGSPDERRHTGPSRGARNGEKQETRGDTMSTTVSVNQSPFWGSDPEESALHPRPTPKGASLTTTKPLQSFGGVGLNWASPSSAVPGNSIGPTAGPCGTMSALWRFASRSDVRSGA